MPERRCRLEGVRRARVRPRVIRGRFEASPGHREGEPLDRKAVPNPKLMIVEYEDGLRAFLLELNGAIGTWTAAWRYQDDRKIESTPVLDPGSPARRSFHPASSTASRR